MKSARAFWKSAGVINILYCIAIDIITNTRCVLNDAISLGGTTIHSYKSVDGISGKFQNCLLVHGKEGSSCNVCMEKIVKIKVGGRGTYYCPNCQKLKK